MVELTLVEQQVALDQPGKLQYGAETLDCMVVQLSRKGAQVRFGGECQEGKLQEAKEVFLSIEGFGQLSCRVVDSDGDYADLRFQGDPETQDSVFQELLAQMGDDEGRRRYLRRSVLWPGTLKGGPGQMDCTILNMSLGGAKVALSQQHDCSGSVTLFGDRFDGLEATVMWQRGRVVGLQFKAEPAEIARILGDLLPAIKASA
ncbi:PilZ domain-containing protein [Pelagibius marinus]|uniref:PilZ domain-containing protein n=1 Tax=Pelagibius marinus TaxID=2762760 RepID=UPI0018722BEA|nr:PilZ domain-containing protein [Pelagibius marinus]